MKKLLKSKKGFTLVELLAVIVVLAIIMVIATTQINKTIQRSRANSFVSSYQMMYKSMKTSAIQNISGAEAKSMLEYSSDDYNVSVDKDGYKYVLTVCANNIDIDLGSENPEEFSEDGSGAKGKFANMKLTQYYQSSDGEEDDKDKISGNVGSDYKITDHCIYSSYNTTSE